MHKSIRILYEDDHYISFDKPAGVLVIPTPKKEKNTLVDFVNIQYLQNTLSQRSMCPGGDVARANKHKLYPCHRLDRYTSGVILFAKGKRNQQLMMREFKKRTVRKEYIAFVRGKMEKSKGEIKSVIRDLHMRKYARAQNPKLAVTQYEVVKVKKYFSIVKVYPITGRTNQIRIHFSEVGHPLLGERQYAFGRDFILKFRRTALHANKLIWVQPITKKIVKITSLLAKDMEKFIDKK